MALIAAQVKALAEISATMHNINQTQLDIQAQLSTIDRSLLTIAERYTEISADIVDIKDYNERATELVIGMTYELQRRKRTDQSTD